ncbi:mannosyltransferase, variant 3 [Entomophthora muscae]|uniref:Mannosyltransferase, variant 3 n=1 Tax=Entomophthora muscae TaxID=34485 RepID=A0ACC2SS75_9FUNG|nr:mannosyltransferase, variant 3 [Entomophthora muscae]
MGKSKDSLRKRNIKANDTSLIQNAASKNDGLSDSKKLSSHSKQSLDKSWFPSEGIIFGLLLVVRMLGANYANINDCDEVFNFWEPTHFLQYGHGLQTWEYSPVYAIRTWAYILIHYFPLKASEVFFSNKVTQFYSLRSLLSAVSAFCETWMVKEIAMYISPQVGIFTLLFLLVSPGMFHAAPAFLPSTFAMYTTTVFFSGAIRPASDLKRRNKCMLALGVGCLLGWPFSAAVGIPFVLEEFYFSLTQTTHPKVTSLLKNLATLVFLVLKIAICVTLPIVAIDYYFYKKITLVPFNIVLYNVLGASDSAGPNIFGTEPWTFYFKNGFLNYSICFLLALASFPILLLDCLGFRSRPATLGSQSAGPLLFKLTPFYWWLGLFLLQPHKEERFLFVIYPLFAFNSAISLVLLKDRLSLLVSKMAGIDSKKISWLFVMGVTMIYSAFSIGRIYGQYDYFYGTLELYNALNSKGSELLEMNAHETATVCVGGEWFRFPSHYFLPGNSTLSFVKANFDGLLPKPFPSGPWRESISSIPTNTNNQNREEIDRYVSLTSFNLPDPDLKSNQMS